MKKEIWAYLETDSRGELLSSSKELLAKAGIIAATAEEEEKYLICALLAGAEHDVLENTAEKALGAGADKAVLIEGDELAVYSAEFYSDAIGRLAGTEKPKMILFERTTDGMDLAPVWPPGCRRGMISDCVDLVKRVGISLDPPCFRRDCSSGLRVSPGAERGRRSFPSGPEGFGGSGRRADNFVKIFSPDVLRAAAHPPPPMGAACSDEGRQRSRQAWYRTQRPGKMRQRCHYHAIRPYRVC